MTLITASDKLTCTTREEIGDNNDYLYSADFYKMFEVAHKIITLKKRLSRI